MSETPPSIQVTLKQRSTGPWWKVDPRVVLAGYMRGLAIVFLATGIMRWSVVIGASEWSGQGFDLLSVPMQGAMVYFAVIDLVAAVGLWLAAPWGGVVWLLSAMSRVLLHTGFMATFGQENLSVMLQVATILAYLTLAYQADRAEARM
ncbi:MAG: hypothetical protein JNM13_07340 [Hyphomicrobiaceae bacterium]|nr:hypothetical protein [Hyphomicrobiaceae bacterium]